MTQERIVFRVQFNAEADRWFVRRGASKTAWTHPQKKRAVSHAARCAKDSWKIDGRPAQVVVHNRDGRISEERTYGRDPERTKG